MGKSGPEVYEFQYKPMKLPSRTALILFIPLFLPSAFGSGACRSSDKGEPEKIKPDKNNPFARLQEKPDPDAPLYRVPPGFFLLPLHPEKKHLMTDLLTAPLMDRESLEKTARGMEERTRESLRRRRKELKRLYCSLSPRKIRGKALRSWRAILERDSRVWTALERNYENALRLHLRLILEKEEPGLNPGPVFQARKLVRDLRRERRTLISDFWSRLIQFLEDSSGSACLPDKPLAKKEKLPGELLFLPLYIGRYRFYSMLTPRSRARLILELHSGRETDK